MLAMQQSPTCAEACCPARTPVATRWQPCVNFATLEGAATGVKQVYYSNLLVIPTVLMRWKSDTGNALTSSFVLSG